MLEFIKKSEGTKNLLIFIHGFIGGKSTWVKEEGEMPFIDLILKDNNINSDFNVALFIYDTKLTEFFPKAKMFANLLKKKKNTTSLPIEDISKLLATQIQYKCKDYNNIVFIGHSMGGLVAKKFIIDDLNKNTSTKVKMYISLATPHSGSDFATLGKKIIQNSQIQDLTPLGKTISDLNDDWIKCNNLPLRFYGQGLSDQVVPMTSSRSYDSEQQKIIYSNDDHFSIIIPDNNEDIIVTAIIDELKKLLLSESTKVLNTPERFVDAGQFDNEAFVLKLLIADIHMVLVNSSKQAFFNAEFVVRKFRALGIDMNFLISIYEKIKELYSIEFAELLTGKYKTSNELINAIHKKILAEDKNYLNTIFPTIEGLHKYGMLHQLSNIDENIWWAKENNIKTMMEFEQKISEKVNK